MARERSWKTTTVVVIAVAAALVVVWKLRSSGDPAPPPKEGKPAAERGEPTPHRISARPVRGQPDEPSTSDEPRPPTTDVSGDRRPMAELLRSAPAEMRAAARHCVDPDKHPPNSAERVTFRYTVIYRDGEASVSDVVPVDTNINDEGLQNCILDAVEQLLWPAPGADARSSPRQQLSISIYDLTR